jgi:hypothetical protein
MRHEPISIRSSLSRRIITLIGYCHTEDIIEWSTPPSAIPPSHRDEPLRVHGCQCCAHGTNCSLTVPLSRSRHPDCSTHGSRPSSAPPGQLEMLTGMVSSHITLHRVLQCVCRVHTHHTLNLSPLSPRFFSTTIVFIIYISAALLTLLSGMVCTIQYI